MQLTALAGLFACTIIIAANSSSVSAQASDLILNDNQESIPLLLSSLKTTDTNTALKDENIKVVEPPVQTHEIKSSDSLSSIAEQYQTTWIRLFNKNENIVDPDVIIPGTVITIPKPEEQLKDRLLPNTDESSSIQNPAPQSPKVKKNTAKVVSSTSRGSVAGNSYSPGYCTWYAKNMRPDMPNNLGNANTWVSRAAAEGFSTGSSPRVGAIGQQGMHVVYVHSVNADGTVTISEMNYQGLYVISSRTVPASNFQYIY